VNKIIPAPVEVAREALIVLGGIVIAAFIISRFPALQAFVQSNSVTLKDANGNVIW
jgi:hypothetical protein